MGQNCGVHHVELTLEVKQMPPKRVILDIIPTTEVEVGLQNRYNPFENIIFDESIASITVSSAMDVLEAWD